MKIAFMTTIFPMPDDYLMVFFDSLRDQTYSDFDIIVVNDGNINFKTIKDKYNDLRLIEIKVSGTPAENRQIGVNYIKEMGYDILVFGDSDDYFSQNRVEVSVDKLKNYDVVVNDLTLFDSEGIQRPYYISSRLNNNSEVTLDYIKDKNIFGMTNTAVKVNRLANIDVPNDIVAVDWYMFSIVLGTGGRSVFTNDTVSYYRQYDDNITGLGVVSESLLAMATKVKLKHYNVMSEISPDYGELYDELVRFDGSLISKEDFGDKNVNLLWWEYAKGLKV